MYTPPRDQHYSTSAKLVILWHLAPEGTPAPNTEDDAPNLHAWPAGQESSWRSPREGLPVAPAVEGLSLAATLQQHPHEMVRPFLQAGIVPAAPPGWQWDTKEVQPLPDSCVFPLW